jgi:AraC family transcriptional regulator, ethanolamine operon transcriptional activator
MPARRDEAVEGHPMPPFPQDLVLEAAFSDFDALADATSGWNLTFSQVGRGNFSGTMRMAATSHLQIVQQDWSASLLVEGEPPRDTASIAVVMSAAGGVRWLGAEVEASRTLFGGHREHEVQFLGLGAVEILAISMSQQLLDQHLNSRFATESAALGKDLMWRIDPHAAGSRARGQALNLLRGALASGAAAGVGARHHLQEAAMQILLEGVQIGPEHSSVPLSLRRQTVRAAEEVLRARLDDPPSVSEMCQLTGVSERTLQLAFQDIHAVSPKRYLRTLRLNAARRKLRRCEGSVTEIAASLGFFHFARFATEYRELFDQLPSETLRQARLERGPAAR